MNLLVAGRVTGSCLIIVGYFVILLISSLYGAIIKVIADVVHRGTSDIKFNKKAIAVTSAIKNIVI